jgi:hypothetical protein
MIITIGSQASGETGLKIWMNGLIAVLNTLLKPQRIPTGTATIDAIKEPVKTVFKAGEDLVNVGWLAGVFAFLPFTGGVLREKAFLRSAWRCRTRIPGCARRGDRPEVFGFHPDRRRDRAISNRS